VLHVRVVTPPERCTDLLDRLHSNDAVINVAVLPGASRRPAGDVVMFDVANETANEVIADLRALGLDRVGSIAVERIAVSLSDVAARAEAHAPGDTSEAVVWEEVEARIRDESALSATFIALLVVAVLIGAVGILTDSAILIVGAMVVGPEYPALSSISLGVHKRRLRRVRRGLVTIGVGFSAAIAAALLFGAIIRATDRTPRVYELGLRPVTDFISHPDFFTVIVAVLAGVAGTLSLTEAKAGTLVGVLVSVTTVPAASNIGLALAYGRGEEAWGASQQLLLNLVLLVFAGAATMRVQYWAWARLGARRAARAANPRRARS
jgi:uncharacterized hydrophobic protein (TIGR00271 family)